MAITSITPAVAASPGFSRLVRLLSTWSPQFFVILATAFGVLYAVFLPPFQVPDEWQHFQRAYVVSTGHCVTPPLVQIPQDYGTTYARFPRSLDTLALSRHAIQNVELSLREPSSAQFDSIPRKQISAAIYSCLPYLGSGVAMAIVRTAGLGALPQLYAARLADLLLYVGIVAFAISIMPLNRFVCIALALLPMSLQQAASASADAVTIAVSWLFTGLVLRSAFGNMRVDRKAAIMILLCAIAVGLCKVPATLVLAPMLIPVRRFGKVFRWAAFSVVTVVASLGAAAVWARLNASYNSEVAAAIENNALSIGANTRYLLTDPIHVLQAFGSDLSLNAGFYVSSFIGLLGYLTVILPAWYVAAAIVSLTVIAILREPLEARPTVFQRVLALALFVSGAISMYFAFYITMTPIAEIVRHFTDGQGIFQGMQGRYFLPSALLCFASVAGLVTTRFASAIRTVLIAFVAVAGLSVALCALYVTQWLPSILTLEGHPPPYLDPRSLEGKMLETHTGKLAGAKQLEYNGLRFWISDDRWFPRHHRDPNDVIALPEDVLAHLPWGGIVDDPDAEFYQTKMAHSFDGMLVRVARAPVLWTVYEGRRHLITDPSQILQAGFPIANISRAQLNQIPLGMPILRTHQYDGEIIRRAGDTSGRLYVVQDSVRHWVLERSWLVNHGLDDDSKIVTVDDRTFDELPVGQPIR